MKQLIITSLILLLLPLVACDKPDEEPTAPNLQAAVDCAETVAAHQYLLMQHEELKGICQRSQEKQAEYAAAVRILEDANLKLRIELALVKSLEVGRAGDYENLLNALAVLRAEKKEWGIFAAKEYEQLLKNYNQLQELYPPKNFPDHTTLVEWRADSGNVTELGDLGLQNLAFKEGYLVSVCPTLDYCVAIVGEWWYKITPGDQDLVEKIRRVKTEK